LVFIIDKGYAAEASRTPTGFEVRRSFFYFDTMSIPNAATVVDVKLKLWGYSAKEGNSQYVIQQGTQTDYLSDGDFDSFTGPEWGLIDTWTVGAYNTITFNANGRSGIDKAGVTKICIRDYSYDFLNREPTQINRIGVCYSECSGTDKRPLLEVTYTAPIEPEGFGYYVPTVFGSADTLGFTLTGNIYDDSATGFAYGHRVNNKLLFAHTDASKVSGNGQPYWSGYSNLVLFGGPLANKVLKYYEGVNKPPLKYVGTATHYTIVSTANPSNQLLSVPYSSVGPSIDYFVVEVFSDGMHYVISLWGLAQWGTYASGVYFDGIFNSIPSMACSWQIVRWKDLNGNGVPDYPNEFTVVASG
jgi:hypothetical protein